MDMIDADWIKSRLTGQHGEKSALAEAMGLTSDKFTKVLNGTRRLQPREMIAAARYFGAEMPSGLADPSADFARPLAPNDRLTAIAQAACPTATRPFYYLARSAAPGAGILPGDILVLIHGPAIRAGHLVIISQEGAQGEGKNSLRRHLPPILAATDMSDPEPSLRDDAPDVAIIGHVQAVIRAPEVTPISDP